MRLVVVLLAAVVISAQERQVGQGVNFYSRENEAVIGIRLARELRRKTDSLDSAAVRDFVENIGRSLTAHSPVAGIPYTFSIVADDVGGPTHEPLAVPGGYIFVPAGLILTARNEAECAGMVGHAMAHIAARHGTRLMTRRQLTKVPSISFAFVGGWTDMPGMFEIEADLLAIKMTSAAGYDPMALILYIGRMRTVDTARRTSRIAHMEKAIRGLPSAKYSSRAGFEPIQSEVRRLMSQRAFL